MVSDAVSEYQLQYPHWIDGLKDYQETAKKQKLLAYAMKSHTPIFGDVPYDTNPRLDKPHLRCSKSEAKPGECVPAVSRSIGRLCRAKSVPPKPEAAKKRRGRSVPPKKVRFEGSAVRRNIAKEDLSNASTSKYLQLLCHTDNIKPRGYTFKNTMFY